MNVYVCTICSAEGMNAKENVCAARRDLLVRQITALADRIAALENWPGTLKRRMEFLADNWEPRVVALEEWRDQVNDFDRRPATAPPPAPEEEHKSKLYERMGKVWAAAAPPEQAQETGEEMARRVTKKALHDALAPEQARRTWEVHPGKNTTALYECSGIGCNDCKLYGAPFIVTQLRPGERIASGERVRCHKWQNGRIYMCDGPGCAGVEHGIYYPDAPPRAEGE